MGKSSFKGASQIVLVVKNPLANAGDMKTQVQALGFPGGGHGNMLQYSCLENPMDKRSLVDYSPWGCKELDAFEATQQVHMQALKSQVCKIPHICFQLVIT